MTDNLTLRPFLPHYAHIARRNAYRCLVWSHVAARDCLNLILEPSLPATGHGRPASVCLMSQHTHMYMYIYIVFFSAMSGTGSKSCTLDTAAFRWVPSSKIRQHSSIKFLLALPSAIIKRPQLQWQHWQWRKQCKTSPSRNSCSNHWDIIHQHTSTTATTATTATTTAITTQARNRSTRNSKKTRRTRTQITQSLRPLKIRTATTRETTKPREEWRPQGHKVYNDQTSSSTTTTDAR